MPSMGPSSPISHLHRLVCNQTDTTLPLGRSITVGLDSSISFNRIRPVPRLTQTWWNALDPSPAIPLIPIGPTINMKFLAFLVLVASPLLSTQALAKCFKGAKGNSVEARKVIPEVCNVLSGPYGRYKEYRTWCNKERDGLKWDFKVERFEDSGGYLAPSTCEFWMNSIVDTCEYGGNTNRDEIKGGMVVKPWTFTYVILSNVLNPSSVRHRA